MSITKEQTQAVKARGRVLVSASAGSGKTTVMIKRLADILEEGASLDEVLAVTFTKKAAAQMKARLRTELISRLDSDDGERRENIRNQLGKINSADICTIHSFCARLVRTYFYVLDVNCAFDVLSDAEAVSLRGAAIDGLFTRLYEEKNADLYALLAKFRKRRSDDSLKRIILSAYDEVRIRPRYKRYLSEVIDATFTQEGFERVCKAYGASLSYRCLALAEATEEFKAQFKISKNAEAYLAILDEIIKSLRQCAANGNVFALPGKLFATPKPKKYKDMPAADAEADNAFMAFRDGVQKKFSSLCQGLEARQVELERFLQSGSLAKSFAAVLNAFDEAYCGVKREECKLDYGDLEQLALKLLTEGDGDVRAQINAKYRYVFVDEYQDVNPIQDEIIGAVAGEDLFCVGDVKQAIYGFRGSRSRFFEEKCKEDGVRHVVLPDNFRSSPQIISFVNKLFSKVMRPPVCSLNYENGHAMRGGTRYPQGNEGFAGICHFKNTNTEKEKAEGVYSVTGQAAKARPYTAEGLAVLQLVERALRGKRYDPDRGCEVKIEAGDICVLTRKKSSGSANGIVRALTSKYAVAGASEANVCDRPEIIRLLGVLSYIDNPEQDVPLVTALLSPLGGLDEGELATIRAWGGTGKEAPLFRECVWAYFKENENAISKKLAAFYMETERLKALSACVGAARLIDELVGAGGFYTEYDTEIKLCALRRLQKEAYSSSGELFLPAFLTKLKNGGYNVSAPPALAADCIKVMTMHASKGLEFPVVIVADICASFKGDDSKEMLFDDYFGFAPRYYGEGDRTYRNTLLRRLCKATAEREELDNEINLLYVACTRAGYALHVLCGDTEGYSPIGASYASSYAELFNVNDFNPVLLPGYSMEEGVANGKNLLNPDIADEEVLKCIREVADYAYPHADVTGLPVKDSASHIISIRDGDSTPHVLFREFEEDEGASGIERGVAYHRFLQLCDFALCDENGVNAQLANMVYEGLLTERQRSLLKVDELVKILSMPVFKGAADADDFREREFIFKIPAAEYLRLSDGSGGGNVNSTDLSDGVIIQGAIDLLLIHREGGRAVSADVIDYKYSNRGDGAIIQKYSPQLALYKGAVCRAYSLSPELVTTTVINIKKQRLIKIT